MHQGTFWDAELAVLALEDRVKPLGECHQRLFDEQAFTQEHFSRLELLVLTPEDALRLHEHPSCPQDLKDRLNARYDVEALVKELDAAQG